MNNTRRLALSAVMVALALGLSYMERFFPLQLLIPMPGVKLGLANIVSLVALYFLGARSALVILAMRCVLGAMFGGSISGLMYSLTGGLLSMAVMAAAHRLPFLSVYGVSILGAAAHNIGQIAVSMAVLQSVYVLGYLPYLLGVALVTGMLTGTIASGAFRAMLGIGFAPHRR